MIETNSELLLPAPCRKDCHLVPNSAATREETVDGAQVLNAMAWHFNRFLCLFTGAADAMALWAALTHCVEYFLHAPRLAFCSPEPGSGKTTALRLLGHFCARPILMIDPSEATLCRLIHEGRPTLILDEFDTWLPHSRGLLSLLNGGHQQGYVRPRCRGGRYEVYKIFAAVALGGLNELPATLRSRSLVIRMLPPKRGETRMPLHASDVGNQIELARKLARWAYDNRQALQDCRPTLPSAAVNRTADNWRPLFAIAEIAGGDWPERAREAFASFQAKAGEEVSTGKRLLKCIRTVFDQTGADKISSKELVTELNTLEMPLWDNPHGSPQLTVLTIAQLLRPYAIAPTTLRLPKGLAKGYYRSAFEDAFERFLN